MKKHPKKSDNEIATNKKARHDYLIEETFEAGISLTGTEIKSVRNRRVNLKDGYVQIRNDEAWLMNVHINEYEQGNRFNHDQLRNRKLLLHKKQIHKLAGVVQEKGITIVPLKMYFKNGFAKVLIGIGRGKKQYDKRETIKRREQDREVKRTIKLNMR